MKKETLSNLRISPKDIAEDYNNGEQKYNTYLKYVEYSNEGLSAMDIIRAGNIVRAQSEYRFIRDKFKRWIDGTKMPDAVGAINALHSIGIFPSSESASGETERLRVMNEEIDDFNYKNSLLPHLNMLSFLEFRKGRICNDVSSTAKRLEFPDKYYTPLIISLLDILLNNG